MSGIGDQITLASVGSVDKPAISTAVEEVNKTLKNLIEVRYSSHLGQHPESRKRIVLATPDSIALADISKARHRLYATDRFIVVGDAPSPEFVTEFVSSCRVQKPDRVTFLPTSPRAIAADIVRLFRLMASPMPEHRIFFAHFAMDTLYVVNALLEHSKIPLASLERFRPESGRAEWSLLKVDAVAGSFIFWPELDLHLGWPELKKIEDPSYASPLADDLLHDLRNLGQALKSLRKEKGFASRQKLVEKIGSAGLSEKTIERVENGEQFPSAKTVQKLSQAFGMSSDELLRALSERV